MRPLCRRQPAKQHARAAVEVLQMLGGNLDRKPTGYITHRREQRQATVFGNGFPRHCGQALVL